MCYAQRSILGSAPTRPDGPALRIIQYCSLGSILSPLLSNVALSVLDEHIAHGPGGPGINRLEAAKRRRRGLANYRLVRYADDWCLAVFGTKAQAEALREEIAQVLSGMGLRLSQEKTLITHIDEGQDFLGWRIQRHRKPGTNRHYVYTYPAEEGPTGRQSEGQDPVPAGRNEPAARHPAAPTQPGAAGLERPLPIRGVLRNLQLPRLLHVADGLAMAATQTPPGDVEADPPPLLRRWMVAIQRQQGTVQPGRGGHRPLPLPGHDHSQPLANHRMRTNTTQPTRGLWRAGCRANRHVRFGKRPEETDRSKDRHRASGRLHHTGRAARLPADLPPAPPPDRRRASPHGPAPAHPAAARRPARRYGRPRRAGPVRDQPAGRHRDPRRPGRRPDRHRMGHPRPEPVRQPPRRAGGRDRPGPGADPQRTQVRPLR